MNSPAILVRDREDVLLLQKALDYNKRFRLGTKMQNYTKRLDNIFHDKIKRIKSIGPGEVGEKVGGSTAGCFYTKDRPNGNGLDYYIEFYSIAGKREAQKKEIMEAMTHEVSHAYSTFLPMMYRDSSQAIKDGNYLYQNSFAGRINKHALNGKFIGSYGQMAIETTNDILTTAMLAKFEPGYLNESVDTVMKSNYTSYGGRDVSAYTFLTSITKLLINAFSNSTISYDKLLDNGLGIADIPIQTKNGKQVQANDFLYGMLCDPIHIQLEYDKIMGKGKYEELSKKLDSLYYQHLAGRKLDTTIVKEVMNTIPDFANKKAKKYINDGIFTRKDCSIMTSEFNTLWNSMQKQYEAYFSKAEIEAIAKRAHEN